MRILFLISIFLFSGPLAFANTYIVGLTEDGTNRRFEIMEGCAPIYNVLTNLDGYKVSSKIGIQELIIFCGPLKYVATDELRILEKIAQKGFQANCFQTHIDKINKVIVFSLLPDSVKVTSSSYSRTSVEGDKIQEGPKKEVSVKHVCVLDKSHFKSATELPRFHQ